MLAHRAAKEWRERASGLKHTNGHRAELQHTGTAQSCSTVL